MAMTVGSDDSDDEVIAAINTTPLVDVMLVLLIIFLITIPVIVQTAQVVLPKERNVPTQTKPENVVLSVTKEGDVFWGAEKIPNQDALVQRLIDKVSNLDPQPEVHIRGDKEGRYEFVGKVVVACQRAGIAKVGFITEPPPTTAGN
jgi:biopolymer transport protein ExbD